jgi:hypothetical protein
MGLHLPQPSRLLRCHIRERVTREALPLISSFEETQRCCPLRDSRNIWSIPGSVLNGALEEHLSSLGNSIKEALLSRSLPWDHNLRVNGLQGREQLRNISSSYLAPLFTSNINKRVLLLVRSSPFVRRLLLRFVRVRGQFADTTVASALGLGFIVVDVVY